MAFIGIKINPDVARAFRNLEVEGEKVAENEYHITVLCFEENWAIKHVAKAMEAAYKVISEIDPFYIKVDQITCFPKREDNPVPIIARVKSKELDELNSKLKKAFDKEKIEYLKTFKDFKPHITLAYAEKEIKSERIDPVEFFVYEIILWCGDEGDDRFFITIPLKSSEKKNKNSFLIQKTNLFHKLSKRNSDDTFVKSVERRKIERIK